MKISTHTHLLEKRFGALPSIRMICEAGFEAIDYSMYEGDEAALGSGGIALAREMRRVAESYGVSFNQTHAPFSKFSLDPERREKNREIYDGIRRAMEIAAELGAPRIIVHPAVMCHDITPDRRYELNMELYGALLPHARDCGVGIAIENMYGRHRDFREKIIKNVCSDAEEMIRYVDGISDPLVTACLDTGHAALVGESCDVMARRLGDRLSCIHIHDNGFYVDEHTLPYLGKTNFEALSTALSDIGYKGDVTLESNYFFSGLPDGLVADALVYAAKTASYIRGLIR